MYDMSTDHIGPIVTEGHDQFSPLIYGNNIAWRDKRNGNFDVYYKTFSNAARSMSSVMSWDSGPNNWDWDGAKLTVGDYNGDGLADIGALWVCSSASKPRFYLYFQRHQCFYAPTTWWDSGVGNWDWNGSTPLSGDFSGDGQADVAAFYNYSGQRQTRVFNLK